MKNETIATPSQLALFFTLLQFLDKMSIGLWPPKVSIYPDQSGKIKIKGVETFYFETVVDGIFVLDIMIQNYHYELCE